ncbi:Molybdate-anion transporter [Hondaea fermentalgiana]|uniref:Molybdate-anion transporter n=1 Tax=Hondaea fermentalgiana TaxID=2315210 RepID=A0A2R5G7Y7_9STRA|nr:Molybdate-anion transporter [Hondaea fermentalgiana]|eukprot:GBG25908.1 Molybdate-anion transporter [Hondaea fermentalgiana]
MQSTAPLLAPSEADCQICGDDECETDEYLHTSRLDALGTRSGVESPHLHVEANNEMLDILERRYLAVYALMVAGDWLQGPYIYALYETYGFTRHEIALLFVAGFVTAMIAGASCGALADRAGRRTLAVVYAIMYAGSCLTKHVNKFAWLLLGRVLGGMATSLLFSVFEAWIVCESTLHGANQKILSRILSHAMLVNSVVAILCGVLAAPLTHLWPLTPISPHLYVGGYLIVFDLAILVLVAGGALALATCMLGSQLVASKTVRMAPPTRLVLLCLIASLSLALGPFLLEFLPSKQQRIAQGVGFVIFEGCVGAYYPTMGALRSMEVTEVHRATIYSIFRIPLNAFVVLVLLSDVSVRMAFIYRTVDMINDRITTYPREAIAGIMCMEILGIYGAHQLLVLSGVQVPAEYALAFAMGRPLRRLRFPLELAAAGLLCRIEPALQRVRVTDAIAKAVPQRLRERWSSNDTLKASGEAVGKAIDGYGAAYFIGARYVGVGVVLTFYAAIMQGFDVTNFLAGYGFQNFGTVLGTWAAAVSMSAILYPLLSVTDE